MNTELFERYLDLLLEASATMNLTSVTERGAARSLHVDDALTLLPFLPAGQIKIVDVGSGGGCPGIPLAIARPDAQVTCVEATKKKADFLKRTAQALAISNLTVIAARAEDVALGELRESFDVATARALGQLVWVAEFCLPLVKPRGRVLAMKGPKAAAELEAATRAIGKLGGGKAVVHPTPRPGTEGHVVVEIPKIARTNVRFPRPPSESKGRPL